VSFLSTLYGVVSARMVYMPAASRLQQEIDARQRRLSLITEGMVMLAEGDTASHIHDRLNGFLRPEQHDYFDAITGSDAEHGRHHETRPRHRTGKSGPGIVCRKYRPRSGHEAASSPPPGITADMPTTGLITYADTITLLLCLFVVILSVKTSGGTLRKCHGGAGQ